MAGLLHPQGSPAGGWIPAISVYGEALAVALEHVHWCRRRGLSAADICAAIGTRFGPGPGARGWDDAVWLVAGAWLGLPNIETTRAVHSAEPGTAQLPLPGIEPSAGITGGKSTMSRIRSLHPSQWTEEDFVACSPWARLLLLGLRNEADDNGVFEWRPQSLKLRLFPADDLAIEPLLDELVGHGLVFGYEIDGRRYGKCMAWAQQPQHPSYRYPMPPADEMVDSSVSPLEDSGALTSPHPVTVTVMVKESKKGGLRARARQAAPPPKDLPDEWREAARQERVDDGLPEADLDDQWRRFTTLNAGETDTPARWRGRWHNWARDAKGSFAGNRAAPAAPENPAAQPDSARPPEDAAAVARRLWWGRSPDWWIRFSSTDAIHARAWVDRGSWGERWFGGPPGASECKLDDELARAAIAERALRTEAGSGRVEEAPLSPAAATIAAALAANLISPRRRKLKPRDQRQPEMLMVVPGGAVGTSTSAAATALPADPPAARPVRVRASRR